MHKKLIAAAVSIALTTAMQARAADDATLPPPGAQQASTPQQPQPAALSLAELKQMAPTNLVTALTQLPQFYGNATTTNFNSAGNGFFTSPGAGAVNLRGLGQNRTLTLLNGARVVPSTLYGGPDINLFPEAAIKSVETVTGGASAAYGTDAVSGVVNFILDTKFEGLKLNAQHGKTTRGDNRNDK